MGRYRSVELARLDDSRGSLVSLESSRSIPFQIRRVYYIFDTRHGESRGYHAHRKLKQLVVCVSGKCRIYVHDGANQAEFLLDRPTKGLVIDGMVWREMHDFSTDCVLMVLADEYYDEGDYIRNFAVFQREVRNA